jgi:hypothetical protein
MSRQYILVGHQVVSCSDLLTWAHWFETADRHVKLTEQGDVMVSTVFLGLDHGYLGGDDRLPVVFETMVFQGGHGDDQERYCTWDEAEAGHARWVAKVFKATPILKLPLSEKA